MQLLAWLSCAWTAAALSTTPLTFASDDNDNDNHNRTVSPTTFASLEELARLVDISYCVGSTGIQKPFKCLSRCSDFEGDLELVTTWNTGPLLSDSSGYIALSHALLQKEQKTKTKKRVIVAFRGTYSLANTIADLSAVPAPYEPFPPPQDNDDSAVCATAADDEDDDAAVLLQHMHQQPKKRRLHGECSNCTVHSGFMRSWRNARCTVVAHVEQALREHAGYELTLVGHSLGGAVAVLAALEFQARGWEPHVTTFGEPRVGNKAFNAFVDQRFNLLLDDDDDDDDGRLYRRVTHVNDPVPLLPLEEWGYTMHAGEVYISKSGLPPSEPDLQHCSGDEDPLCIAASATSTLLLQGGDDDNDHPPSDSTHDYGLIGHRFRLWELLFAHRDYFWRLGLCVPGGDPWHWSGDQHADGMGEYDELR